MFSILMGSGKRFAAVDPNLIDGFNTLNSVMSNSPANSYSTFVQSSCSSKRGDTHNTAGTYSWNMRNVNSFDGADSGNCYAYRAITIPTGYSRIKIDYFISAANNPGGSVYLSEDNVGNIQTATSGSGTFTVTVGEGANIYYFGLDGAGSQGFDAYFDNFRVTDALDTLTTLADSFETWNTNYQPTQSQLSVYSLSSVAAGVTSIGASHITEGAACLNVFGTTTSDAVLELTSLNASAFSSLLIDVYVSSIPVGDRVLWIISNNSAVGDYKFAQTSTGTTGAFTLSINITGMEKDNLFFQIFNGSVVSSTVYNMDSGLRGNFYFDNLRGVV